MLESGFLDFYPHFEKRGGGWWWIKLSEKNNGKASLEALESHFCPNQDRNPKNFFQTKFYFCFNSKTRKYETWGTV